jgi:hypothetical protein
VSETPQPCDIKEYPYIGGLSYIRVLEFEDDSSLMYYPDGTIKIGYTPWNVEKVPPPVPLAKLYYWHVEENRPDVNTWEDIKAAESV